MTAALPTGPPFLLIKTLALSWKCPGLTIPTESLHNEGSCLRFSDWSVTFTLLIYLFLPCGGKRDLFSIVVVHSFGDGEVERF